MNIFVYGDESGVFDRAHNDVFVFGGLIFLGKESKDAQYRKFIHAERAILPSYGSSLKGGEPKACMLKPKHKAGLFRSTNGEFRYAFVVDQEKVNNGIFGNKKSKQRYLDYVFKVGLKTCFGKMIRGGSLDPNDVDNVYVRFDEHTTATDGRYELGEGMKEEYKNGTFNFRYNTFHPPIFPKMSGSVFLDFKDSRNDALIRASDIIANRVWYNETHGGGHMDRSKVMIVRFP